MSIALSSGKMIKPVLHHFAGVNAGTPRLSLSTIEGFGRGSAGGGERGGHLAKCR